MACLSGALYSAFLIWSEFYLYTDIGADTYTQFYPMYTHFSEYFRTWGYPTWTFQQGMGQNMSFLLLWEPFAVIYYICGPDLILYLMPYVHVLKLIFISLVIFKYLEKIGLPRHWILAGVLLYTFNAFNILGGTWHHYTSQGAAFALLLLALERGIQDGRCGLIAVPTFFVMVWSPFYIFQYSLFILVYIITRLIWMNRLNMRSAGKCFSGFLVYGILGIGISAFIAVPYISQMLQSPRVTGDAVLEIPFRQLPFFHLERFDYYLTAFLRFFSNNLQGCGDDFQGWVNYLIAPLFYTGVLPILLLPASLLSVNKRRRQVLVLVLAAAALIILFPYFRYALYLFMGEYFMYLSFLISVLIWLTAIAALKRIESFPLNPKVIPVFSSVLGFALILAGYFSETVTWTTLLAVLGLIAGYSVCLHLIFRPQLRVWVIPVMYVLIITEMMMDANQTVNNRQTVTQQDYLNGTGYFDDAGSAVRELKAVDSSFYRMMKDYFSEECQYPSLNENQLQGYFGTMSYQSFNQASYIDYLLVNGIIDGVPEQETRWAPGLTERPVLLTLAHNKYVLTRSKLDEFVENGYTPKFQMSDLVVLENQNFLPLGYTYSQFITESRFQSFGFAERERLYLQAVVLESLPPSGSGLLAEFKDFEKIENEYRSEEYSELIQALKTDTLEVTEFSHTRISGRIRIDTPKLVYFGIPYDKGWKLTDNGHNAELLRANIGFMGTLLEPGGHELQLEYAPKSHLAGAGISGISVAVFLMVNLIHSRRKKLRSPDCASAASRS